jgi:hypothetical protein
VTRTGVTKVNISQNGPRTRWKRPAHPRPCESANPPRSCRWPRRTGASCGRPARKDGARVLRWSAAARQRARLLSVGRLGSESSAHVDRRDAGLVHRCRVSPTRAALQGLLHAAVRLNNISGQEQTLHRYSSVKAAAENARAASGPRTARRREIARRRPRRCRGRTRNPGAASTR